MTIKQLTWTNQFSNSIVLIYIPYFPQIKITIFCINFYLKYLSLKFIVFIQPEAFVHVLKEN